MMTLQGLTSWLFGRERSRAATDASAHPVDTMDRAVPTTDEVHIPDMSQLPKLYEGIRVKTTTGLKTEDVRDIVDRLVHLDTFTLKQHMESLRTVADNFKGLLERRDADIARLQEEIEAIDAALRTPADLGAIQLDQQTRTELQELQQTILKEKFRALYYMQVILEVYKAIHEARETRIRQVEIVKKSLKAIEAAEERARRASRLRMEMLQSAHRDRGELEGALAAISPELLQFVQETAELQSELILEGSDLLHTASGTFQRREELDRVLSESGEALAFPRVLKGRLQELKLVKRHASALEENEKLDPNEVGMLQRKLLLDVQTTLGHEVLETPKEKVGLNKHVDTASTCFNECVLIHETLGDQPVAVTRITAIVHEDDALSSNELTEIERWYPDSLALRMAILGHPNLNSPLAKQMLMRFNGKVTEEFMQRLLDKQIVTYEILLQYLCFTEYGNLVLNHVRTALTHKAAGFSVESKVTEPSILKLLVENENYSFIAELLANSTVLTVKPEIAENLFKTLANCYPANDPHVHIFDHRSVYTVHIRDRRREAANGDVYKRNVEHFLNMAVTYYKSHLTSPHGVNSAVLSIIVDWIKSLPRVYAHNPESNFGFVDLCPGGHRFSLYHTYTRLHNERENIRTNEFDLHPLLDVVLSDSSVDADCFNRLLDELPSSYIDSKIAQILSHPKCSPTRLKEHYERVDLSKKHANALARNSELAKEGLEKIWAKCDPEHQILIINHQNATDRVVKVLSTQGETEEVKLTAQEKMQLLSSQGFVGMVCG